MSDDRDRTRDNAALPLVPALTAEEWAELLRYQKESGERYIADGYGSQYFHELADERCGKSQQAGHHLVAALALHGQPFGFTREDVEAIYRRMYGLNTSIAVYKGKILEATTATAAGAFRDEAFRAAEEYARLESLAARIAALLPPEGA